MTEQELMAAYEATKIGFDLKWRQRSALDASPYYLDVMTAAHEGRWDDVRNLLTQAGVI
jgi:hypothetical protein